MSNRSIWSGIGACVAAAIVAVPFLFWSGDRSPPTFDERPPGADVPTDPGHAAAAVPSATDEAGSEPVSALPEPVDPPVPSLEDLSRLCIDPWSVSPAGCAEALDRRYLGEPVGLAGLHNGPSEWSRSAAPPASEGVAWEAVFADPSRTRATAQAALRRSECRIPPAEERPDLGAECAVDEIAKLAMLQAGCVMELVYYKPGFNPWGLPDDLPALEQRAPEMDAKWWQYEALDEEVSLPLDEYYRRRTEIDDARFRFAWRLMRCKAVPEDALAWLDGLPTPAAGGHQGRDLTEAAARLGSEWATRELRQTKELVEKEWREEWKRQQRESQDRGPAVPAERD